MTQEISKKLSSLLKKVSNIEENLNTVLTAGGCDCNKLIGTPGACKKPCGLKQSLEKLNTQINQLLSQ